MKYYKVRPEFDNKRKSPDGIYIGGELYTPAEVRKQNLNRNYLEEVEVNKREIYFFFGARFAD